MSRIGFNRKKAKFGALIGIRGRLVLFALILVGPLMVERIRALDNTRSREIALTTRDFASVAQHSVDAQREVFSSIEAVLKSSAFIFTSAARVSRSCAIMRSSLRGDMPWIRSITIAARDGRVLCSTWSETVDPDINFSDRPYFKKVLATGEFVVSDYLFSRIAKKPTVMAAYLAAGIDRDDDAVILAAVDLQWMSKIMGQLGGRTGVTAVLVDAAGTVLAAPSDQASMIGRMMDEPEILPAIARTTAKSGTEAGALSFTSASGIVRAVSFAGVPGTSAKLIVSINESVMSADVNREIRTAYVQFALVCLFVLLGAIVVGERIIIQPIRLMEDMAKRFGRGDWSARVARDSLPTEFRPLARAFYGMAAQLRGRERELRAGNDQLTLLASIDMLSGLANRRGFQSRLEAEWQAAQRCGCDVALLMIDVDHFKMFNDTYGHLEGDSCLGRIGTELGTVALAASGFAGRYGGEEFCLLLPNADLAKATEIGEMVRTAISNLAMPHATSAFRHVTVSVGVAALSQGRSQGQMAQAKDLIEAADAALYAAKRRGRNTVVEHGLIRALEQPVSLAS